MEAGIRLSEFREKVKALQQEWERVFAGLTKPSRRKGRQRKAITRGLRTPEHAYRRPTLEALVELGGQAPLNDVLKVVERKMKDVLNRYDYERLSSGEVRWRNTAQWCRNTLVREGLMKSDSPRGIWEISESGRKALQTGTV